MKRIEDRTVLAFKNAQKSSEIAALAYRVLELLVCREIEKAQRLNELEGECHFKILWRHMLKRFRQVSLRSVSGMSICPVNLRVEGCKFEPAICFHSIAAH